MKSILIAGLGLIGGSLAKAIKRSHPNMIIIGVDKDKTNVDLAAADGFIIDAEPSEDEKVDICFVCTPVNAIVDVAVKMSRYVKSGGIITDVGSTKNKILQKLNDAVPSDIYIIGGHPMTGTEKTGFASAMPHLFENAWYVLTPAHDVPSDKLDSLSELLTSIGALPVVMQPDSHDKAVAAISHLPHIAASALVHLLSSQDDIREDGTRLAAGGFRDITRIASGSPCMWSAISLSNKEMILDMMDKYIAVISDFRRTLVNGDEDIIFDWFKKAKETRDSLPDRQSLSAMPWWDLHLDVEDRAGVIGEVATMLGLAGLNIKNIRIINSREGVGGCMALSFTTRGDRDDAKQLLSEKGFTTYISV